MTEPLKKESLKFMIHKKKVLNSNKSIHYQAKGKIVRYLREMSKEAGDARQDIGELNFDKLKITIIACPPTRRKIDPPNLYHTAKALIDGLTDANWWEDDNYKHVLDFGFRYGGLSGDPDHFRFFLMFEEISDDIAKGYILDSEYHDDEEIIKRFFDSNIQKLGK